MPLPSDEKLLELADHLIAQFDTIFGEHPGYRPAHAKGAIFTGTFTPAEGASTLTRAPHIAAPSTPVTVRFSNSTGLPSIPDSDPNADPRGMAIRFHLGEHTHTDIVSHSTDGFPTRTGDEFLSFLRALASTPPGAPSPSPIELFLGANPAALAFVQTPKPAPESFATEAYFGVTAYEFLNADGASQFGRYRILPEAGLHLLDDAARAEMAPDYLFEEIAARIAASPVSYKVTVQLAAAGDVADDATIHWPEDRPIFELGTLTLTAPVADNATEQKQIIFDPIPRGDGIEPSGDPLLELRAAVYLMSGRRRRKA
jgi:catalase